MPPRPVLTIAEDKGGEEKDHDEEGTVFSMSEFSEFTEGSGDYTQSPTSYYSSDKPSSRSKHASITEGWLLEQERRRRRNQGWSGTSYDDKIEKDEEEEIVLDVGGSEQEQEQQVRSITPIDRVTQQKQAENEVEEEEDLDYGVLARIQLPKIENVSKPKITNFLSQTYRLGNLEVTRHRAPGIKAVPPCNLATDLRTGERMAVKRFWLGKPTSGWRGFQVFDHRVSGVGIRPNDEDVWMSVREILARIGGLPDARTARHFFRQGTKIYIAYGLEFK
ncbi:hypothetical protein BC937DRAFT_92256 [Endogone sp. FLAS-F59071]|nr:hypothetical protein BC937DRAFT_92256 [Endogone sp. FLAS-F59071]|eukprot:RUS15592.1 hypothetical protein BC937DRAFT_92256 [Endogone sp. FLAS-F59071]